MTENKSSVDAELSGIDQTVEDRSMNTLDARAIERAGTISADRIIWAVWWIGTIIIVLSWLRVVSNTVGWIGFAAALASSFASVMVRKYWRIPR